MHLKDGKSNVGVVMQMADPDPTVLRYVRGNELTAALVQPKRPLTLKLICAIPEKTSNATLRFCDFPPVKIIFTAP